MKQKFLDTLDEFNLYKKADIIQFVKCLVFVLFQIISFIWKPFVFIEFIYIILVILTEKKEDKIIYLGFLLPFYNVFRYGTNNTQFSNIFDNLLNTYFSVWVLLLICIIYFIRNIIDLVKHKKYLNIKKLLCFISLYLFLLIPFKNVLGGFSSLVTITSLFTIIYLVLEYKDEINFKKLTNVWFFALVLSVILSLFKNILPYMNEYIVIFKDRFNGLARDPNYWAFEILCLLCVFSVYYLKGHIKYSYAIYFIILSGLGLLSLSKAFYITYFIFAVIMATLIISAKFKSTTNKKKTIIKLLIASFSILILLLIFYAVFRSKINFMFERMCEFVQASSFEGMLDMLTTHRYSIWKKYLNKIVSGPVQFIFGAGICAGYDAEAIHNTYIQLLYFGGGLFIIGLLTIVIINLVKNKKLRNFSNYLTIVVLAIMLLSLDIMFSYRFYLVLMCMIFMLDLKDKGKESNVGKQDSNKKVSVVIPVYKSEKYIDKCVNSLINQEYKNLEIILVDDGSPDNSAKICDEWAKKDDRIKVVHKMNGGVSSARNEGIKVASGDYITFVDSDDYVTGEFSNSLKKIDNQDLIIVPYFYEKSNKRKLIIPNIEWLNKTVFELNCGRVGNANYNSVWLKIVNKKIINENNINFDTSLVIAEDLKFSIELLNKSSKVEFMGWPYYVYSVNNESVMNSVSYAKICDTLKVCKFMIEHLPEIKDKKKLKFTKKLLSENLFSVLSRVGEYNEEENKALYLELENLKKYIVYGSNLAKKILVCLIRLFGIKFVVRLLNIRKK